MATTPWPPAAQIEMRPRLPGPASCSCLASEATIRPPVAANGCPAASEEPLTLSFDGSIDGDKLNVNGSSLGAGHPFAATGGRIVATLAKLLDQKGSGRGLISICAAGGQGVVAIVEK